MKEKIKKTPAEKRKLALKIILIVFISLAVVLGALSAASAICANINSRMITMADPVKYENQLKPVLDKNGNAVFTTDGEFKVLHLTDVHIGGGFLSVNKDSRALDAVATMITEEQPDLVVVTGDIAYPIPFQSGTFNNKTGARLFAELMEELEVYWAPTFGNHDTEVYSFYNREKMAEFYSQEKYEHCLFQAGPEDVDGQGNYVINVKNTKGEITQSFFMLDTNDYVGNPVLSALTYEYDTIHENQVKWYEETLKGFKAENNGVMPKSIAFFHIPLPEFKSAWDEFVANDYKDTENVKYVDGYPGERKDIIFPGIVNYGFFDKALELGSTKGMFFGHDHLNSFSLDYKGIQMGYGYSVDYLAYPGIKNYGKQRGCGIINVKPDGSYETYIENYYQDKYDPLREKEEVVTDSEYYAERNPISTTVENQ